MDTSTPTVAVLGGGIGGLSAAQELAERGFGVTVYEANARFGGKARSLPVPRSDDRSPLMGEHGFRFFPGYYRNLTDTMARIPCGGGTVADNLVETGETLIASVTGPERRSSSTTPETIGEWVAALQPTIGGGEIPLGETGYFLRRLLVLLTSCRARRLSEYDDISWWEFIDADARSPAYRKHLAHSTQALVALRPEVGSARTIGTIYLQLMLDQIDPNRPNETVLNGPTSEVWIDPWTEYLEGLGVDLQPNAAAREIGCDGRRVTGVDVERDGTTRTVTADYYVAAVPVEVMASLVTEELGRAAPSLRSVEQLETAWMNGVQFFLAEDAPLVRGHQAFTDAPWALTAISQRQFWDEGDYDLTASGDGSVRGILSVIISDWETPGVLYGKPARLCSREEIRAEVWEQLCSHLNREEERLSEATIRDWFLDPAIVEGEDGMTNSEPLLINTVGSLRHRPEAATAIPNLVLAADYVRTETDLATMESANEAARRAVRAIVRRSGVDEPLPDVWGLEEPAVFDPLKRQDAINYRLGLPHPGEVERSVRGSIRSLVSPATAESVVSGLLR